MMGIAGAKRNNCRRFLSPIEIQGQRFNEDMASNPSLVMWFDFTDPSTIFSWESGLSDTVEAGERVGAIYNKVLNPGGVFGNHTSIGGKAIGGHVLATSSSAAPYWLPNSGGNPSFAYFNGTTNYLYGMGSTTPAETGNFSTTDLLVPGYSIFIVCNRDNPESAQHQQVFNLWDSSGNRAITAYFTNTKYFQVAQINGANVTGTTYDYIDSPILHYHMYNSYNEFMTSNTTVTLEADGACQAWGLYNHSKLN